MPCYNIFKADILAFQGKFLAFPGKLFNIFPSGTNYILIHHPHRTKFDPKSSVFKVSHSISKFIFDHGPYLLNFMQLANADRLVGNLISKDLENLCTLTFFVYGHPVLYSFLSGVMII